MLESTFYKQYVKLTPFERKKTFIVHKKHGEISYKEAFSHMFHTKKTGPLKEYIMDYVAKFKGKLK